MDEEAKREAALALLARTGMPRRSYAPPMYRHLWRLGINLPPIHFASFWTNLAVYASLMVGVIMFSSLASDFTVLGHAKSAREIEIMVITALVVGSVTAAGIAAYYAVKKRQLRLPDWKDFDPRP
jgi:hypothetical protein